MSHYSTAAEFYDLLYQDETNYGAEAALIAEIIRERNPDARTILDVACGTGSHARALTDIGFQVDGIDLELSFIERARAKCPEGTFQLGDMRRIDLPQRYDAMEAAFNAAGLTVQRKSELLRGLYVGHRHR